MAAWILQRRRGTRREKSSESGCYSGRGDSEYRPDYAKAFGKSGQTLKRESCEVGFEIDVLKFAHLLYAKGV